ncbi:Crp/Fnr family transcriptional regulator [Pseudanabaena sp. PCC 6802]|uniref:Crp/Fnr family transcriptional regulator n=1 Tax=Pseudanabaena sp. PCC 6802 TaxID=118173 RepID=UPI00034CB9AE|nr:Crp/Fnr family transcriptional regulator [Pseudanabaena sp. PCC 6802]
MSIESALRDWLQTTLMFRGLSLEQLGSVAQIAQLQRFQKGEIVFMQDSEATGFFIIKMGRVKIFKTAPNGKEQILRIFEPGENFAEVPALDGRRFPASASALEPTELILFPRRSFLDVLHQYPDIAINMLISLSQHLRHLTDLVEDLSFKDVPQRLASYLLKLSDSYSGIQRDRANSGNNIVTLDLTKSQLAATLGTIPATLSRAFYRLTSEGLIAVHGAQIELLDRDRLQSLSDMLELSDREST